MVGIVVQRLLVLIITAIAAMLFQLEERVVPDIVGHIVAHSASCKASDSSGGV